MMSPCCPSKVVILHSSIERFLESLTAVKKDRNALCVQIRLESPGRGPSRQPPNSLRLRVWRIRATEDGFVMGGAAGTVSGSMGDLVLPRTQVRFA